MQDLIDPRVIDSAAGLAARFARREPFRHVVIDGFFRDDYARALLATFPAFESGNARNEAGELGGKSVVEKIRALGGEWAALDDAIQAPRVSSTWSRASPASPTCCTTRGTSAAAPTRTAKARTSTRTSTSTAIRSSAGTGA